MFPISPASEKWAIVVQVGSCLSRQLLRVPFFCSVLSFFWAWSYRTSALLTSLCATGHLSRLPPLNVQNVFPFFFFAPRPPPPSPGVSTLRDEPSHRHPRQDNQSRRAVPLPVSVLELHHTGQGVLGDLECLLHDRRGDRQARRRILVQVARLPGARPRRAVCFFATTAAAAAAAAVDDLYRRGGRGGRRFAAVAAAPVGPGAGPGAGGGCSCGGGGGVGPGLQGGFFADFVEDLPQERRERGGLAASEEVEGAVLD